MSDIDLGPTSPKAKSRRRSLRDRLNALTASRGFQRWAARFPLTKGITRREGEALFDIVQGFVASQTLMALVDLGVLDQLTDGPLSAGSLAHRTGVPVDRLLVLLRAGVALKLLAWRGADIALARRGAALTGVPGLQDMIRHHKVLYADMADPAAFYRGETDPDLARFWPYVFGAGAAEDPEMADRYSRLMTESQALVADETLAAVSLTDVQHLMDVGGGTGAFLCAALGRHAGLKATLFDLPAVLAGAEARLRAEGVADRVVLAGGSFRDDALPTGADAISLVRVLYDHADDTVAALLKAAYTALPPGGRLIISEPMRGSAAGDVYYPAYTLAMGTGKTRSSGEIEDLLRRAGFVQVRPRRTSRPFVTGVVTAAKPDA